MAYTGMYDPASPGELLKEFLGERPIGELADRIGVARATVSRILHGHTGVSVEMSVKLGQALGVSEDFFARAQLQRDLWLASRKKRRKITPLSGAKNDEARPREGVRMARRPPVAGISSGEVREA